MAIPLYLTMEDIAPELDQEPAELFRLLTLLADHDEAHIARTCKLAAEAHSGSLADQRVVPFLRRLADDLEKVEG